jgi:hypothetical protein
MIAHWERVGPELERIRRAELREIDYEANRSVIDALLQIACERAVLRTTSGLVDLQRLLARGAR